MAFDASRQSAVFVQQQNLIRGALGNRRTRGFKADSTASPELIFRTNIRRIFLRARAALDRGEFGRLLDWYEGVRVAEFGGRGEGSIGFDYLNGIIDGPVVPLWKEIDWTVARLRVEIDALRAFRIEARVLDALCVRGAYGEALAKLEDIVEHRGESMWSVQLRLALEQRHGGLEAQKAYLEHVRAQYRQGILSYVAYNTSVRNEERTSWQRFAEGVRAASAKRKHRPLADYLNYRLLNQWPETAAGLANVLRLEQSHSIVDIYETFVVLCQLALVRADLDGLRPGLRRAAATLAGINDFRLHKIAQIPLDQRRDEAASVALASGRPKVALRAACSGELAASDPWSAIYAAAAFAAAGKKAELVKGLFSNLIVRFMSLRGATAQDAYELEKLCHNFAGLPVARGVAAFVKAVYGISDGNTFQFKHVGLNSPLDGREDEAGIHVVLDREEAADTRARPIAHAIRAFHQGDIESARKRLRPAMFQGKRDLLERLADLVWLRCADIANDFGEVVATVSRLGSVDPSLIPLLPIVDILGNHRSHDYKSLIGSLAPLNALNMLWKVGNDDGAASTLKLMTGHFLRSRAEQRPSLLVEAEPAFDRHELIYFLREVCVPSVLDVSRIFAGSKDVIVERQAICATLHALDPNRAEQYSAEVASITRRLKVDEGLKIVDQSRIHVDTDAVTRWARKNVSEDFERYVDLVKAGIGSAGNFDEALREVKEAIKNAKQGEFFTPQNEADNALVRILRALSEEFLNNSTCGLDYFLSKRIRHVSFVGLLRSPLEFSHLIANKPTAQSDYRSNAFWLDKLSTLGSEDRGEVDRAIKEFSKVFDNAVNRLKVEIFHVRSAERPNGIFDIPLSTTVLTLARALLSETSSFEDFLGSVYIIFWAVLESSLAHARRIIDDELKMQIAHAMDELKAEISRHAHEDPAFPELSAAMAQAGSELQASLGEASSWFTRPEIREAMRYFTLEEALDVAIESALKLHRAFGPKINRTVEGDISLSAPDLVFITDAILVAFSNIKAYSRLEAPTVDVSLVLAPETETLTVQVANEVHQSARSSAQDRRILEIARSIEAGAVNKKSRAEGGSGFVKLAAVVHQSSRGRIEFGYVERTRFRLSVTYSILFDSAAINEAA